MNSFVGVYFDVGEHGYNTQEYVTALCNVKEYCIILGVYLQFILLVK